MYKYTNIKNRHHKVRAKKRERGSVCIISFPTQLHPHRSYSLFPSPDVPLSSAFKGAAGEAFGSGTTAATSAARLADVITAVPSAVS
jgi:hypothetical protein